MNRHVPIVLGALAGAVVATAAAAQVTTEAGTVAIDVVRSQNAGVAGDFDPFVEVVVRDADGEVVVDGELATSWGPPEPIMAPSATTAGRHRLEVRIGADRASATTHRFRFGVPRGATEVHVRIATHVEASRAWLVGAETEVRGSAPEGVRLTMRGGIPRLVNAGDARIEVETYPPLAHLDVRHGPDGWFDLGVVTHIVGGCGPGPSVTSVVVEPGSSIDAPIAVRDLPPLGEAVAPFRLRLDVLTVRAVGTTIDSAHAGDRPALRRVEAHELAVELDAEAFATWIAGR